MIGSSQPKLCVPHNILDVPRYCIGGCDRSVDEWCAVPYARSSMRQTGNRIILRLWLVLQ